MKDLSYSRTKQFVCANLPENGSKLLRAADNLEVGQKQVERKKETYSLFWFFLVVALSMRSTV